MTTIQDEFGSLYTDLPYNGLATSSEIILNQMKELGISLDSIEPDGGDSTLTNNIQSLTPAESLEFDPQQSDEMNDAIRALSAQASVPIDKYAADDPITKLYGSTETSPPSTGKKVFDGPEDKGASFGAILTSYGLPTTFGELLSDAEEAFVGILYDLNHIHESRSSVYDILSKNNRLRGLGALFIVIAMVGMLLNNLLVSR